jgi:hypothetical protein
MGHGQPESLLVRALLATFSHMPEVTRNEIGRRFDSDRRLHEGQDCGGCSTRVAGPVRVHGGQAPDPACGHAMRRNGSEGRLVAAH